MGTSTIINLIKYNPHSCKVVTLCHLVLLLLILGCENSYKRFNLLPADQTGISFENHIENSTDLNILNYLYFYNGGGVATADFNNDGLTDIYFTANQSDDKLYINLGNLQFKDITESSGISNSDPWTTGVTVADINNDGFLDIYVSKVSGFLDMKCHNLLFINQGVNSDNIPVFKEQSAEYGIDFRGFSTQASFFDYDLDGDIDMYLLNHSVHPNRSYGRGSKRKEIDSRSGDKLFQNQGGKFIDVTAESGIFQGGIGYGLGLATSDINQDGYPDIYVGNDFFENDYLYINQGDGTFVEQISADSQILGHTTHFSMGNDVADINNDGMNDIISVDMLPEDLQTYKSSALEYNFQIYSNYLKNGYAPQYMQNTLHMNRGGLKFSEAAYLSGIAATEWSWSPLIADFDNDSWPDIYISNGILGATNDMDFINFIADENIQSRLEQGLSKEDQQFIKRIPAKKTTNYFFRNSSSGKFEDMTESWFEKIPSYSNGSAYADLDNDGDLDIVVNNVNDPAFIIENRSSEIEGRGNYLKVKLDDGKNNRFGIGASVSLFSDSLKLSRELFLSRGYQSAVEPVLHFGLGTVSNLDSLVVSWPGGTVQTLKNISANQEISILKQTSGPGTFSALRETTTKTILPADSLFTFEHRENSPVEFNRDPLIPFSSSNQGPGIAVADVNSDGLEDVFICGAKGQASALFLQDASGRFNSEYTELFAEDALNEDTDAAFGDLNEDGLNDLIVVSGGNEFRKGKALIPRIYFNSGTGLVKDESQFTELSVNASAVKLVDFDQDGDLDICITSDCSNLIFGKSAQQYLLENDGGGSFTDVTAKIAPDFQFLGNVKSVSFDDINSDGRPDLIAAGHWMPVTVFLNQDDGFVIQSDNGLSKEPGWWNTIEVIDYDQDGDLDVFAGNWGLNSRLSASDREPITLYSQDFDANGSREPLVTYFYKGVETPFASKEELSKQMPFINKKYLSYQDYASASIEDVFGKDQLRKAEKKQITELASCYFENIGSGQFKKHVLPFNAQLSQINAITLFDVNDDGFKDVLLTGNNYEISTQLSRFDACRGEVLINDKQGGFLLSESFDLDLSGVVRDLEWIKIQDEIYLCVGRNNDTLLTLKLMSDKK